MKPYGLDIPNLIGFWDFSRQSLEVGEVISGVPDLFGSRHLSQEVESRRPTISLLNGRKAAKFVAANTQFLSGTGFTDLDQPVTVFAVVGLTTGAGTPRYFALGDDQVRLGQANFAGTSLGASLISAGQSRQLTSVFNTTLSKIRRNGDQQVVGDVGSQDPGTKVSIGANGNATQPWDGLVGEIILVAGEPEESLMFAIENAQGAKWALGYGEPIPLDGETSESLVAAHEPWITPEHEDYLRVLGAMFTEVEKYGFDIDDFEGWTILLDPDRCPVKALPYLAQYVGERLPTGITEDAARQWIKDAPNQQRGTIGSIVTAARRHLLEPKTVTVIQRAGGNPDRLDVVSYTSQTPDSAKVLAELQTTVPADITLTYTVTSGQTWTQLVAIKAAWSNVVSSYPTWADAVAATPSGSF